MKTIYSEAKQQLSSCMLHDNDVDLDYTTPSSTLTPNNSFSTHLPNAAGKQNHSSPRSHSSSFVAAIGNEATTSTYDTSQRPFKYDRRRGQWSATADFYFACTSHAFGSVIFSEVSVYAVIFGGVYFLPIYLAAIILYAIPIFIIQTFLGQFSTSGTISAFRVAPIFKGIGYSILLLNLVSLAYYGVVAAVPLIYAANSIHSVIPWMSCDNAWNTVNCSTHSTYDEEDDFSYPHATVEFFRYIIRSVNDTQQDFALSWPLVCGTVGVWLFTLGILLKRVSFIGKFFRCVCVLMFAVFIAIFVHLLIYTKITWSTFISFFETPLDSFGSLTGGLRAAILMATWLLGPGWGSVLTLASHNRFHRDSEKLTYWVGFTHVLLALSAMICGRIALDHFEDHVGLYHYHIEEDHYMQFLYLCFAYLFGSFTSLPNFWCFLFFSLLFMAELCAIIIQMMSVLTAIFDEYEALRSKKTRITMALTLFMMTISIYFCTKKGFEHLHVLPNVVILTHVIMSFVLLIMTTWIYGRERFQCDLQCMLGKTISSFKIFLIRFLTPAILIFCMFETLYFLERDESPTELVIITQVVIYAIAPAYMVYKICQTNGTLRNRLKQCFAPHDWHPVDADNRRFYEQVMGISELLELDIDEQSSVNA